MANTTRKHPEPTTTISFILRAVMNERGIPQWKLAEAMGYNTQSAVAERLRGDIRTGTAVRMLDIMNCEIIVRDRQSGKEWRIEEL